MMRSSLRAHFVLPAILAIVCTTLAGVAAVDPRWHQWLDYRRAPVAAGDAWRLATAHAMHMSTEHATLDIGALLIVAWIFGRTLGPARQLVASAVAMGCIDASLWFLHPEVDRYVGLSGVLHAWFAMGSVLWLLVPDPSPHRRVARRAWGGVLSAAIVVKLALEDQAGAFWLGAPDFVVVTAAHRAGALAGLLCGVACVAVSRRASAVAAAASRSPRRAG